MKAKISNINKSKNCKNNDIFIKNANKTAISGLKVQNIKDLSLSSLKHLALIKTLICVHDYLPNIIKVVDDTIAARASSATDGSFIFGDLSGGTFGQIEKVLNLSERKISLVNLYCLINTMVGSLADKYKQVVKLKFYKHKKTEYLAEEFGVDERTIYRWINEALLKLLSYCNKNNWSYSFLCSQIENEGWLYEHYTKHYSNLLTNACK